MKNPLEKSQVRLTVTGEQISPENELLRTKQTAEAVCLYDTAPGEGVVLLYETKEEDGAPPVRNRLVLSQEELKTFRDGLCGLFIRSGEQTEFSYETPYGALPMTARCSELCLMREISGNDLKKIHAKAVYQLRMDAASDWIRCRVEILAVPIA